LLLRLVDNDKGNFCRTAAVDVFGSHDTNGNRAFETQELIGKTFRTKATRGLSIAIDCQTLFKKILIGFRHQLAQFSQDIFAGPREVGSQVNLPAGNQLPFVNQLGIFDTFNMDFERG
jgi:hypothetical protein